MDKLAVLGPSGTFSDIAAGNYLRWSGLALETAYFPTIDDTFLSVGEGCEYGVIPIENTLDGYVQRTLDLLLEREVHVLGETSVPVRFSVVARAAEPGGIRRLFVQFKASGQCRRFIQSLSGASVVITDSNMESYYAARGGEEGDAAVIPSHISTGDAGLLRIDDVTDARDNHTRFIIVRAGELGELALDENKRIRASMYIMPETDRPGILFEILRHFYEQKVNLASIMSRPTKKAMGTYNFYLEVDGSRDEHDKILRVLIALKAAHRVKLLGIYSV